MELPVIAPGIVQVCTGCSLLCEDILWNPAPGGEAVSGKICQRGTDWFEELLGHSLEPGFRQNGKTSTVDDCVDTTSGLLVCAQSAVFIGLEFAGTQDQQKLVELAGMAGGWIGLDGRRAVDSSGLAFQRYGQATATLGEIRRPGTVVLLWGGDSESWPPRLGELHLVEAAAICWIAGRAEIESQGPRMQSRFGPALQMLPFSEMGPTGLLRSLRAGASGMNRPAVSGECLAIEELLSTASRLAVFAADDPGDNRGPDPVVDSLHQWIRTVNSRIPASLVHVPRGRGNRRSAESVLAWTTGLAGGGRLSEGAIQEFGRSGSVRQMILDQAFDLAVVAFLMPGQLDGPLVEALRNRGHGKLVLLSAFEGPLDDLADVLVRVAMPGWDASADFVRLDDMVIAVPARMESHRTDLGKFLERVQVQTGARRTAGQ